MTNDNYFEIKRMSSSHLRLIAKSIPHYIHLKDAKKTPSMDFGTMFHWCMLELDKFNERVYTEPINKRTNEGKELYNQLVAEGKIFLSENELYTLEQMKISYDRVFKNDPIKPHEGIIEQPVLFDFEGLECKAKPDVVKPEYSVVIDFKTIADNSDWSIRNAIKQHRYDIQAEFYRIATNCDTFYFVFCEKNPPYSVRIIELTPDDLERANRDIHKAIKHYKEYVATGNYLEPYEKYSTITL